LALGRRSPKEPACPPQPATEAPTTTAPAKGKKKLIIIIAAVLAVVLLGGAGGAFFMMKKSAAAADAAAAESDGDGEAGAAATPSDNAPARAPRTTPSTAPVFVPLEPFTVNLADRDAERYAQIGITLEIEDPTPADQIKAYMPAIRNNILMAIADRTAADLMGRDGKTRLAESASSAKPRAPWVTCRRRRTRRRRSRGRGRRPPAKKKKRRRRPRAPAGEAPCTSPTSSSNEPRPPGLPCPEAAAHRQMNQQILSQDEVDALLQGITGESQKLEQDDGPTTGLREYDLASQERIVRGRMPTMEVINERFARNIRIGLFNLIRKSPEVSHRRHQGAEVQRLPARDRGAHQLQHHVASSRCAAAG
jgi:flagellar FliL protein